MKLRNGHTDKPIICGKCCGEWSVGHTCEPVGVPEGISPGMNAKDTADNDDEFIEGLIICWASSGKHDLIAYGQGFIDAYACAGLISPEWGARLKKELIRRAG